MIRYVSDAMNELGDIVLRADNKCTDAGIPRAAMVQAGACASQVHEPMLHLVLQGSRTLSVGDRLLDFLPRARGCAGDRWPHGNYAT